MVVRLNLDYISILDEKMIEQGKATYDVQFISVKAKNEKQYSLAGMYGDRNEPFLSDEELKVQLYELITELKENFRVWDTNQFPVQSKTDWDIQLVCNKYCLKELQIVFNDAVLGNTKFKICKMVCLFLQIQGAEVLNASVYYKALVCGNMISQKKTSKQWRGLLRNFPPLNA